MSEGISDVSVRSPVGAAPEAATSSSQENKELPVKQRVIEAQKQGVDLIKSKQGNGFFNTEAKADVKKDAEIVLMQEKQEHGKLDSAGLKAFFRITSSLGAEATGIEKTASENMHVKIGDRLLTLEQWRTELEAAKKLPADGTLPNQQKIDELEKGDFAYDFPKEEAGEGKTDTGEEKPGANSLIKQELQDLEAKKNKSPDDEKLLIMLRLAKRAEKGEMSAIVKDRALRCLNILDSESGAGKIVEDMREETKQAREKLNVLLQNNGWNENKIMGFNNALDSGGIDSLISQGELEKIVGLRDALFGPDENGRSISDDELQKLLDPEHKRDWSKLGNLLGILFALMFAADMAKQALPEENR